MGYINGKKVITVRGTVYIGENINLDATPKGIDTSTNILAFDEDKGIWVGSDTGHWYYWNGTQYADGGVYQAFECDDEMSDVSENAVQNKVIKKYVDDLQDNLENGNIVVAKSKQSKTLQPASEESGSMQEDPFIFQATATNNNTTSTPTSPVAKQLEKQANSVNANQWNNTLSDTVNMTNGSSYGELSAKSLPNNPNDEVLVIGKIDFSLSPNANTNVVHFNISATGHSAYINTNVDVTNGMFAKVFTLDYADSTISLFAFANETFSSGESVKYSDYYIINLSQWDFDTNIITYLTSHPEAFFNYYNGSFADDEGTLINSNGRYLVTIGLNQLNSATSDNEQFIGNYYIQTALHDYVKEANNDFNCYRIRVIPNTNYCISKTKNETLGSIGIVRFVDKYYNLISGNENGYSATQKYVVTTPYNCTYIEISISKYADFNVCVNLSWDGERDGEYEGFVKHVYDTGNEILRSAGSVRDKKNNDGTIKRNVGIVDLSTLSWTLLSNFWTTSDLLSLTKTPSNASILPNIICDKYSKITSLAFDSGAKGITIYYSDGKLIARTGDTVNPPTGTLHYELATPTTEQGTRFSDLIEVEDYSVMYWLDTNGNFVAIPQGCKIFYQADYTGLIDDLGNLTDYDVTNLALKSELTDYVKQVDLSSSISGLASLTIQVKNAYKIGNVLFITIRAKNETGSTITANAGLFSISNINTSYAQSFSCVVYNNGTNTIEKLGVDTVGKITIDKALANGDFVFINISYAIA